MTGTRATLSEIGRFLEARGHKVHCRTISPLSPETRAFLQNYCEMVQGGLKKSEKASTEPKYNTSGKCPGCESKEYFNLYGGSCNKLCAACGTAYDGVSLEEYLQRLARA